MNIPKILVLLQIITGSLALSAINSTDDERIELRHLINANLRISELTTKATNYSLKPLNETSHKDLNKLKDIGNQIHDLRIIAMHRILQVNLNSIYDEVLKRQMKLLNTSTEALDNMDYNKFIAAIDNLNSLDTEKSICPCIKDNENCKYVVNTSESVMEDCNLAYIPDIRDIFVNSSNPGELMYYWYKMNDAHSGIERRRFIQFIRLFRKSSQLLGRRPLVDWYWNYDDHVFIVEISRVINILRPFYLQLHAYLRHFLRQKYGEEIISTNGKIPIHLFKQIFLQSSINPDALEQPHPLMKPPEFDEIFREKNITPLITTRTASKFFESLGLPPLPNEFWSKYVVEKTDFEENENCESNIYHHGNGAALKYCPQVDIRRFFQMHYDMARIEYIDLKKDLPFGLNNDACPGFGSAIAEATMLSASTFKHLHKINLLPDYEHDPKLSLNRLFQMGIHTILELHMLLVNEKFIVGALAHEIHSEIYNCVYWRLMNEIVGVEPPAFRTNESFDVPYELLKNLNKNYQSSKIVSKILGYQLYKALCRVSGEYEKNNASLPLQECDFFGNKNAGHLLSATMSMGAKKPWQNLIEPLTGQQELNADAFIEYFAPLKDWIVQQNIINNVTIGWERSTKCGSDNDDSS